MARPLQYWDIEETAFIVNYTDTCRLTGEDWHKTVQAALNKFSRSDRSYNSIRSKVDHLLKNTNQKKSLKDLILYGTSKIDFNKLPTDLRETILKQRRSSSDRGSATANYYHDINESQLPQKSSLLQADQQHDESQSRNGRTLKQKWFAPIADPCAPPPISGVETVVKVDSDQNQPASSHNETAELSREREEESMIIGNSSLTGTHSQRPISPRSVRRNSVIKLKRSASAAGLEPNDQTYRRHLQPIVQETPNIAENYPLRPLIMPNYNESDYGDADSERSLSSTPSSPEDTTRPPTPVSDTVQELNARLDEVTNGTLTGEIAMAECTQRVDQLQQQLNDNNLLVLSLMEASLEMNDGKLSPDSQQRLQDLRHSFETTPGILIHEMIRIVKGAKHRRDTAQQNLQALMNGRSFEPGAQLRFPLAPVKNQIEDAWTHISAELKEALIDHDTCSVTHLQIPTAYGAGYTASCIDQVMDGDPSQCAQGSRPFRRFRIHTSLERC